MYHLVAFAYIDFLSSFFYSIYFFTKSYLYVHPDVFWFLLYFAFILGYLA